MSTPHFLDIKEWDKKFQLGNIFCFKEEVESRKSKVGGWVSTNAGRVHLPPWLHHCNPSLGKYSSGETRHCILCKVMRRKWKSVFSSRHTQLLQNAKSCLEFSACIYFLQKMCSLVYPHKHTWKSMEKEAFFNWIVSCRIWNYTFLSFFHGRMLHIRGEEGTKNSLSEWMSDWCPNDGRQIGRQLGTFFLLLLFLHHSDSGVGSLLAAC